MALTLSTIATIAIAVLAYFQYKSIAKQADYMRGTLKETKKSADTAHDTFVDAHRPKLVVRFMHAEGIGTLSISGQFLVFNVGGTKASIDRVHSEIVVAEYLPAMASYNGKGGETLADFEVIPGGAKSVNFAATLTIPEKIDISNRVEWLKEKGKTEAHSKNLYVVGWIEYRDDARRVRKMGFCRKYSFETKRFEREPDEDYEYDD
jgi:hypothetical protein